VNIKQGKPRRRLPKVGDIFRFETSDGVFRFGRVIKDDAVVGPFRDAWLIYIYDVTSADGLTIPHLDKDMLLVPPMIVNQSLWSKGFFEVVKNEPLASSDVRMTHCFHNDLTNKWFDEYSNEISVKSKNYGMHALLFDRAACQAIVSALEGWGG